MKRPLLIAAAVLALTSGAKAETRLDLEFTGVWCLIGQRDYVSEGGKMVSKNSWASYERTGCRAKEDEERDWLILFSNGDYRERGTVCKAYGEPAHTGWINYRCTFKRDYDRKPESRYHKWLVDDQILRQGGNGL
jgi:hypothetical protein